jgi:hypothetical protein
MSKQIVLMTETMQRAIDLVQELFHRLDVNEDSFWVRYPDPYSAVDALIKRASEVETAAYYARLRNWQNYLPNVVLDDGEEPDDEP